MWFRIAIPALAAIAAAAPSSAFQTPLRLPVVSNRQWASSITATNEAAVVAPWQRQQQHPASRSKSLPPLRMSDAAAAKEDDGVSGTGTASIPNEIFNMVKSIVGAGVLTLPAGIAAFGNAPSAILPANLLIAVIGMFSAYGFSLIGRVCSWTGGRSYSDAWSKSVGSSTSWVPSVSCTLITCFAILSYSMILGDTVRALLMTAGVETTRTLAMLGITGTTLLPLCLLKNLSSLAPFSLLGIGGMVYTTVAMAFRYLGGAYKLGAPAVKGSAAAAVPAGRYLADVAANYRPAFGDLGASAALSPNVFILISMLSTAFLAHFNAPAFFVELKDNTIKRFNAVVGTSFAIAILFFSLVASLGFLTFGGASSGLILNNFSGGDALMSLSRVAVAVSIVFSYPLIFSGAREGWLDLLRVPSEKRTDSLLNKATLAILSIVTLVATKVEELAFISSFSGAALGSALIYVYPALMFRSAVKQMGEKATKGLKREVPFAMLSAGLGVVMGCIGAKMSFGLL